MLYLTCNSNDNKKLIIFLQDICLFEAVGGAGFRELVQHTMNSTQQTLYNVHILFFLILFNKTICMYYSLFAFRFYYKIIGLSFLGLNSSLWAKAGLGLTNFCGPGPGLDSNCYLQAGLGFKLGHKGH